MSFGGGFGNATGQPSFNSQSSGPFAQSGVFGSTSTPTGFGSASGPSLFNTTPQNTGGSLFGGNTGGSMFGSFGQQNRGFGGGSSVQSFGSGGGPSFGLGAGSSTESPDGSQGTFGKAFDRVPGTAEQGARDAGRTFLFNISMMPEFIGCQPEMLRAADYKKGHKRRSGQIQTPNTVTTMFGGASRFAMSGSSGGTSSHIFGGGSGFGSTSPFGGTTTSGIFGHSTSQPSPAFGTSFGSGTSFAQPTGSSGPFAGTFGNTGGSIFSGTTTASAGFGKTSGPSMFGWKQSGQSIFGGQTAPSFSSSFGQSMGAGIFGQTSGGSVFALSNPSAFPAVTTTPLFGPGTTPGSRFLGATTTSNIFGTQTTGSNLFQQQPTATGNIFGSLGHSTSSIFGPQFSHGQQLSFTGNMGQQIPGQPLFAPQSSTPQIQPPPGGSFVQANMLDNFSINPNWIPEYGLVVPDTTELNRLRADNPLSLDPKMSSHEYMRQQREKMLATRFTSIPIKIRFDDESVQSRDKNGYDINWSSFRFSRPVKKSLVDEIIQSAEEINSGEGVPEASTTEAATRPVSLFSFPTPGNTARESSSAEAAAVVRTESRATENRAVVGLSREDIQDLLPIISQDDYYIFPNMEGLENMVTQKDRTALKSVAAVEIGRTGYGRISFEAPVNLERLQINEHIAIKRGRVENISSLSAFRGIPAVVSLEKIFRFGKGKSGFLTTGAELQEEIEAFKKISSDMDVEFLLYDQHGTWVFKVMDMDSL